MIKITINNQVVEVPEGTTVLAAVRQQGIDIPALCYLDGMEHFTSCMLCLVKDRGRLFPSCSVAAVSGMDIVTEDEEIREARQTGLELLLSEHVGDCEAPCQVACPAHMEIPRMNRLIAAGKWEESLRIVKRDIVLPAVLGRICPAPCEGACHRKTVDEAVSICLLKRFVGDAGTVHPCEVAPSLGKKVAVIGAGPAGLAAAYYLQLRGVETTLFDKAEKAGGQLRTAIPEEVLPREVLDREIEAVLGAGVRFIGNTPVDDQVFNRLKADYDAVVVATGNLDDLTKSYQLAGTPKGLEVNRDTYETSETGIFAIGNVLRSSRLAVRSVGQGKEVAFSVLQYLNEEKISGEPRRFNSRFGKLLQQEFAEYLKESVTGQRNQPAAGGTGFSAEMAVEEAKRCLHCDCRAIDDCKLREWSGFYQASQKRFQTSGRRAMTKHFQNTAIVYEPQKCIKCGICVRLTEKYREKYGLTFVGRGFDVVVGAPFSEPLDQALTETSVEVARACPTGALEVRKKE